MGHPSGTIMQQVEFLKIISHYLAGATKHSLIYQHL